jgi:hypothetical protein
LGRSASLRFPSPLIEPDLPISGIRLSDWLHRKAHGGRPLQAGVSRRHRGTDQPSPYGRAPSEAFGYFQDEERESLRKRIHKLRALAKEKPENPLTVIESFDRKRMVVRKVKAAGSLLPWIRTGISAEGMFD